MSDRRPQSFVPALDGLRGIAILLVLIHHLTIYRPEQGLDSWIAAVPLFGWCGVNLFFVLSGFLITGILLDSRDSDNYYTNFYARRMLRIFPLYYLVLFVALVLLPMLPELHRVIVGANPVPEQLPYWLYLTNFSIADRGMTHGWLDIMWSLAIEEQFYIVWAIVVLLCPTKWLGPLCAIVLVVEPIARILAIADGMDPNDIYVLTWFRLDGLSMGALLAWLHRRGHLEALGRGTLTTALIATAGIVGIVVDEGDSWWWNPQMLQFGFTFIAVGSASMLVSALSRPEQGWWPWLLSAGWLRAFGKYSYCLYLIHLPVMRVVREYLYRPTEDFWATASPWLGQMIFYVMAIAPAFLLAWLSWKIFEAPILRLKERFPY